VCVVCVVCGVYVRCGVVVCCVYVRCGVCVCVFLVCDASLLRLL
jgi:hypothetical protein